MAMLMSLTSILTLISVLALGGLLHVYIKNLKKIKTGFTIGLFIFSLLFLIQNLQNMCMILMVKKCGQVQLKKLINFVRNFFHLSRLQNVYEIVQILPQSLSAVKKSPIFWP